MSMYDKLIPVAREFAMRAHGDQLYGLTQPFVTHLDAVASIVADLPSTPRFPTALLKVVAYLHDVLEDTDAVFSEIESVFGPEVALAVEALTDPPLHSRRDRKKHSHAILDALRPEDVAWHGIALIVKAADRLANVRSCASSRDGRLDMYRVEHAAFAKAVFREGICDPIWNELDKTITEANVR